MTNQNNSKIQELTERWDSLRCNAVKKDNIIIDEFKNVFSETYALLKGFVQKSEISKEYMPLILNVAYFARMTDSESNSRVCAATVITERMLRSCVMGSRMFCAQEDHSMIYSVKERKEIVINFNDLDNALNDVIEVIETNS